MADERDPKVSQRYRELPGEEPPRELDQHILAAAHRAIDTSHAPLVTPAGRHRWYFSLAAAAVLVFAVAITLHVERQQPDGEAVITSSALQESNKELAKQKSPTAQEPAPAPPPVQAQRKEAKPSRPAPTFTPEPPQQPAAPPRAMADAVSPAPGAPPGE